MLNTAESGEQIVFERPKGRVSGGRGRRADLSLQELRRGADDRGYHHRRRVSPTAAARPSCPTASKEV